MEEVRRSFLPSGHHFAFLAKRRNDDGGANGTPAGSMEEVGRMIVPSGHRFALLLAAFHRGAEAA